MIRIRSSFVRSWDPRLGSSGGLFGGRSKVEGEVLGWSRAQQAAFLIFAWREFAREVGSSQYSWAEDLRSLQKVEDDDTDRLDGLKAGDDPAFFGGHSIIATDQGVRGFLQVINDLFTIAQAH